MRPEIGVTYAVAAWGAPGLRSRAAAQFAGLRATDVGAASVVGASRSPRDVAASRGYLGGWPDIIRSTARRCTIPSPSNSSFALNRRDPGERRPSARGAAGPPTTGEELICCAPYAYPRAWEADRYGPLGETRRPRLATFQDALIGVDFGASRGEHRRAHGPQVRPRELTWSRVSSMRLCPIH